MMIGDFVRDRAGLGGKIVNLWFGWAGVEWNNGMSSWIRTRHLTRQKINVS